MEIKVNRTARIGTSFYQLKYGDVFYLPNDTSPTRDYFIKIKNIKSDDENVIANAICLSAAEVTYFYGTDYVQPVSHAEINIEE